MSRTIWKHTFDLAHQQTEITVELGEHHKVVLVALDPQTGDPAIWIEHLPDAAVKRWRRFFIVGTGHDVPDHGEHVGSVVQGRLVWHIYRAPQ